MGRRVDDRPTYRAHPSEYMADGPARTITCHMPADQLTHPLVDVRLGT